MAWKTLTVSSYESGTQEFNSSVPLTTNSRNTGNYALQAISTPYTIFTRTTLPDFVSLRAGCWIRVMNLFNNTIIYFFRFANFDVTTYYGHAAYYHETNHIGLYENPTDNLATIRSSKSPFLRYGERWLHIGLFMCREPQVTTLYINGLKSLSVPLEMNGEMLLMPAGSNIYMQMDDFYVQYSDEAESDTPPPALRFYPLELERDSEQNWLLNPPSLEEQHLAFEVPHTGDSTYIESGVEGDRSMFRVNPTPFAPPYMYDTKLAVLQAFARRVRGADFEFVAERDGHVENSETKTLTPLYAFYQHIIDVAPDGEPMTNDVFNTTRYGVEATGL